jgi:D-alanyl-D-alanine carboxypeptidase
MMSSYCDLNLAASLAFCLSFFNPSMLKADEILSSHLDEARDRAACPGAIVGVFGPSGQPELLLALGHQDDSRTIKMNDRLHMRIASISKMFLGNAVLMLADEGRFKLDDPIAKYIDEIPDGHKITIRMLGLHTSGLPNGIENKELQFAIMDSPNRDWKARELLGYAFQLEPYFPPGERWRYSNTNSILLGILIETVTSKSYEQVVHERLIEPLKLKNTGFASAELPTPGPKAYRFGYPNKVMGYGDTWYDVTHYGAGWTGAAGSMYSTVSDLGLAMPVLATGKLLSTAMRAELTAWTETPRPGTDYGFHIGRRNGWVGHTGDVPGFGAVAMYHPDGLRLRVGKNLGPFGSSRFFYSRSKDIENLINPGYDT